MKILHILFFALLLNAGTAYAQFAAQKEASYIATLKAVTDFKINDEENLSELAALRENERFKQKLNRMMSKLSNNRSKNSTNEKVYRILIKAGKDIYNELD